MRLGALLFVSLVMAAGVAACEGCRAPSGRAADRAESEVGPSTVRLYIVSDVAGALEPCGCVQDQLGGLDHAAALIASEKGRARATALVSAGPLFFLDPVLSDERRAQEIAKAETMATALSKMGFAAFAPGRNCWAAGGEVLSRLATLSGGALLYANAKSGAPAGAAPFAVRDVGGVKVAFVGVSAPESARDAAPVEGLASAPAGEAVRVAAAEAQKQGAKVTIVLASVGRGEAKRIADAVPSLTAIIVGTPGSGGDLNTAPPPPDRVGDVLILETSNHLQTLGVLDLFVRGEGGFADGNARVPPTGSFYRYSLREVRDKLGADPALRDVLTGYYKRVNQENRVAFADRKPRAAGPGEAHYVGVAKCSECHAAARAVWDATPHGHAYATLQRGFKEFNLDCVGCHVTGYERPGGSNVTHVEGLTDVQCENCHGPGSKHVAAQGDKTLITRRPKDDVCVACHSPPHVHAFDPGKKMAAILGPGHGLPVGAR